MLGIRLSPDADARLARQWIPERLDRDSIDAQLSHAAKIAAGTDQASDWVASDWDD